MITQKTGAFGEAKAKEYLESIGYNILAQNYSCNQGELDIVARDTDELVFVEVKARKSFIYGNPCEAVDKTKQKKLILAAQRYIIDNNIEECIMRFDVVEVLFSRIGERYRLKELNHIKNAFWTG